MARRKTKHEPHVRLYAHEMRVPAWTTLDPDAKALLVELRSLYSGGENRVYMSIREAGRRLNIGQRRAQRAINALVDRGWVRIIQKGSFSYKLRHATEFALENQPLEDKDGAVPPKTYMRWKPDPQKNTVAKMTTDSSQNDYRGPP